MFLLIKIPRHIPTCSIFWYLIRKHNPIIIPSNIIEQPFRFPILGECNPMDKSSHSMKWDYNGIMKLNHSLYFISPPIQHH